MPDAPVLPRVALLRQESTAALKNSAFQVGMVVAIARHRKGWTQDELAARSGMPQEYISNIENGRAVPGRVTDQTIDDLFAKLGVASDTFSRQIAFVKYWRDAH